MPRPSARAAYIHVGYPTAYPKVNHRNGFLGAIYMYTGYPTAYPLQRRSRPRVAAKRRKEIGDSS